MKTLKLKAIIVSWMATIIAIGGISGFAFGQTTASSKTYSGFKQEKAAINKDLNNINLQQEKVKSLKQQCKDEHAAGVKSSTTHSNLIRAKADLNKEKAYLKADKKELLAKHQAIVEYKKVSIREDREELREARRKLDADLAAGKSTAVLYAQDIVNLKQKLNQEEIALENAQADKDFDMAVVNKEIRDWNGQYASLLSTEDKRRTARAQSSNGSVKNQTVVMK